MKKKSGRANNGMGSIRQRPDGRWEARYSTPDGKQKSVYGKTEKEVTGKLKKVLHDLDTGAWREPSKLTVSEWLDLWLKDYQTGTSERTVYKYRCIAEKHYKPVLGDLRLVKVTPYHIQHFVATLQTSLAATTVNHYTAVLETAFQRAVDQKLIPENPVSVRLKSESPKPFRIIDRQDIPRFIEAANQTRYANELKTLLYTGMRVGELRGLQWPDIDFNAGTLYVQRQLQPKRQGMKRVTTPKYNEKRKFHIPTVALNVLREQKKLQAEQRLKAGDKWHEDATTKDLVFRQPNGKPHGEHTIYFAVRKVGLALDIPDLSPHDLRHSYAIAALRSGADVKTVQHNLGHKTTTMTLEVYAAYTNDAGQQSAAKLSAYLDNAQQ